MANPQVQKTQDQTSQQQNKSPGKDSGSDFGQRGQTATNPTDMKNGEACGSGRTQDQQQGSQRPGDQSGLGERQGKHGAPAGKNAAGAGNIDADVDDVDSDVTGALNSGGKRPGQDRAANAGDSQGSTGRQDASNRSGKEQGDQSLSSADKNKRGS